jgi:hypothetical protein
MFAIGRPVFPRRSIFVFSGFEACSEAAFFALEADPGLFEGTFQDYEEMKRMEPQKEPAPAKKRRVV